MSSSSSENESDGSNYLVPKKKNTLMVHISQRKQQRYRFEWEREDNFKRWLCQISGGSAFCKACKTTIKPRHASILQHHYTNKHARNMQDFTEPGPVSDNQITYIVEAEGWPAPTTFVADLPTVPPEVATPATPAAAAAPAPASATPAPPTPTRIKKERKELSPQKNRKDHSDHRRFDEYAFKQKFAQTKTKNKQTQTVIFNKRIELLDLQMRLEQEVADKKKCLLDAEINIKLVELEIKRLQYEEMKKVTIVEIHHQHNNMPSHENMPSI